eukprot:CAMPEP_0171789364 /NCGR_PEP_ID=MMETSP0991-20121206/65060_1 /TAXON_ID=483369 /ORGANISM="non described non described, Strain CCMP2098" /LENGTH=294 /DNA_ID=CAMNT_0012398709 /DNA_START=218 /DNA_END=1100 /DNA_ORIENTATION=+
MKEQEPPPTKVAHSENPSAREEEEEGAIAEARHMGLCAMMLLRLRASPSALQLFSLDYYERQGAYLPVLAYFITLTRGLDVVFSPLMSAITDIAPSWGKGFGRRKPFLALGCAPLAVSLMMLLFPPYAMVTATTSAPISFWYGGTFLAFNVLQTVVVAPYESMAPDLTKDRRERRRLFWLTMTYDSLGALVTASLPLLLDAGLQWLPKGDCSSQSVDTVTTASCDVLNNRIRFGILGLAFALLIVATNFIVVTQVQEIEDDGAGDSAITLALAGNSNANRLARPTGVEEQEARE